MFGARPIDGGFHELAAGAGSAQSGVDVGVVEDDVRAGDGVRHFRHPLSLGHQYERAAVVRMLVNNIHRGLLQDNANGGPRSAA